jgi:hypothetical protein
MSPARLIDVATQLTLTSADTPEHQERLRRAVSTAYYAMFHTLANSNANALIGAPTNDNDTAAWNRTYRALEHGAARSRFRNTNHMASFPNTVREFTDTFNDLQSERHAADYNPGPTFTVSGALRTIDQARQAILIFHSIPPEVRRSLATYILFGNRPE